jgi:hypothetical protein
MEFIRILIVCFLPLSSCLIVWGAGWGCGAAQASVIREENLKPGRPIGSSRA